MVRSPSPDKPPIRRYRRLVGWDYSKGASFFITIATEPRRSLFGKVEKGAMVLSPLNRQAARIALATPRGMAMSADPVHPDHLNIIRTAAELGEAASILIFSG